MRRRKKQPGLPDEAAMVRCRTDGNGWAFVRLTLGRRSRSAFPSPRSVACRSPSWDRSRGKLSLSVPGSPMNGVVEPARKEVLSLPAPPSPATPPPTAEAQSPVTPVQTSVTAEPVANGGHVDDEEWVTVFGFSLGETNLVLQEFEKFGVILRHHSGPRDGNWIHIYILYQSSYTARKAIQKSGIQLSSGLIVGVKSIDRVHRQQLDESFTSSNQGGFMVSLPSKSFAFKGTGASNKLGALPRPYDPNASASAIWDAGRRATGSIAAPKKSVVTNVMDLIFGI